MQCSGFMLDSRFEMTTSPEGMAVITIAPQTAAPPAAPKASKAPKAPKAPTPAGAPAPAPAPAGDAVPTNPDGKPLSKKQLKKLAKKQAHEAKQKEKAAAAAAAAASGAGAGSGAGGGMSARAAKKAAKAAAAAKKAAEAPAEFVNTTPKGEKKDVTTEMLATYQPRAVEAAWDDWWSAAGFFTADPKAAAAAAPEDKFIMVIPPPNVTGSLHLGHALTSAIEDALCRWHRMRGKHVMWLPGTDHAGIATQAVVERRLMKEKGITRHDLGREAFLKEVWKWKETYGGRITNQLRRLGVSVDWSRERFTMDDFLSRGVTEAFVRMHASKRITRGSRLVNWSCALTTAISNIEVDSVEIKAFHKRKVPGYGDRMLEFGTLTDFAYKVKDSEEEIVVATTRLETMLGDTAVAVHPDDPRYTHMHGKKLVHPFNGRLIPIITDSILVDMKFGTGAVKITPAHDPNDFKAGQRHGLEEITVIDDNGNMNAEGGDLFKGMPRFDARIAVEAELKKLGLFRGKRGNDMVIPICSRSGDVIEPLIKPQWWVDVAEMSARSVDAVRSGELRIVPDFHTDTWYRWLEDPQDWCISRQLWWGHRIPAWLPQVAGNPPPSGNKTEDWIVARDEADAMQQAKARFGCSEADITLHQDPDVLDTWFSSGLFPFSTFGWPNDANPDLKAFYPNTLLETGHDILFFWVARMVMMGLELTDSLPFNTVYLHAMVRDKYGRKMSKSLGNVIDPLEVIYGCPKATLVEKITSGNLPEAEVTKAVAGIEEEYPDGLPECGADALRFGLLAYTIQGRDINLDISRVVSYRHFCNKLWNAMRFALMGFEGYTHDLTLEQLVASLSPDATAPRDKWILGRLGATIVDVTRSMEEFVFGVGCTALYNFLYHDLFNMYLELTKPVFRSGSPAAQLAARRTLLLCMEMGLRLLHPFMPFVTEELWQRLPTRGHNENAATPDAPSICVASWPAPLPSFADPAVAAQFAVARTVIDTGRSVRSTSKVKDNAKVTFLVAGADDSGAVTTFLEDIACMINAERVDVVAAAPEDTDAYAAAPASDALTVYMQLAGAIDVDAMVDKINRDIKSTQKRQASLATAMGRPMYKEKVPEKVQVADAAKMEALAKELLELHASRDNLAAMQAKARK